MDSGRIPDKEPDMAPSPWHVSFEDAVAKNANVERVADTQPGTPWMARPSVAPIFNATPVGGAGQNPFAPSLEKLPKPAQPILSPNAFAPPPTVPVRPADRPAPVAPPFAAPEAPDAGTGKPAPIVQPPFTIPVQPAPIVQPAPLVQPRPADTPPVTVLPGLPPGGRAQLGGGLDQTIPWNQWIRQNPGGGIPPGPGLPGQGGIAGIGGVPAPPAGRDHPGINPTQQVVNLSPEARKAIDDALHDGVPVESHILIGGTVGAAINTAKWGLDLAYKNGKVQWWEPLSPMMKTLGDAKERLESAEVAHAAAKGTLAAADEVLGPVTAQTRGILGDLTKQVAGDTLLKQHIFLQDASNFLDPTNVKNILGTGQEVALGKKLFVAGSKEAKTLVDLANHHAGVAVAADPAALQSAHQALIDGIGTKLSAEHAAAVAAGPLGESSLSLLNSQRAFLSSPENLANIKKIQSVIGTVDQVAAATPVGGVTKLFVAGSPEATTLLERAQAQAEFYKADGLLSAADKNLKRFQTEMQAAQDAGAGNGFYAARNGFLTGALVTGGVMSAGYLADKYLVQNNVQLNGLDRVLIDGVAIPSLLLADAIPKRFRFGGALLLFGYARVKGYYDNAGVPALTQSSLLLRPNIVDTVGLTAAALAPVDPKWKLGLGLGALAAGRLYNLGAHALGWDGPQGTELRENMQHSLENDANTRSASSYTKALDSAVYLATKHKAGEGALDVQLADTINAQSGMNPLDFLRQHAILEEATGFARLEKGSRIVEGGKNAVEVYGDNSRILKDKKYDFLCEATLALSQAFRDLTDLRFAEYQEKAKVNGDSTLTADGRKAKLDLIDDQMKQCDTERNKISAALKGIFGDHDINSIFKELTEACHNRSTDMDQILYKRQQLFDTLSTGTDPQIRAKFARDLALGFLAEAQYRIPKDNGEEANIMYIRAMDFLAKAQSLEPNNPNNNKIQTIAANMAGKIPKAINNQYNNHWNNPNQLTPTTPSLMPSTPSLSGIMQGLKLPGLN